ncbi:MAG: porin [Chthonomonadales bacterium]|nr:porin [Chthonomonadales bacterium]
MNAIHRIGRSCARVLIGILVCAAMAGAASPVRADEPKVTVTGLLDWYYQYSFRHPPAGAALAGRSFDVKHDSFSLSLAEASVTRPVTADSPVGFTATLTFGKTADLVHATEPGGTDTYKHLQQLYATYLTRGPHPVTIDFGKFVTPFGYEVIESAANDNYSRGFLFNYAIPFYHVGLRLTCPLTDALAGRLLLVNGWNNAEDDNGGKSAGAQLSYTGRGGLNVTLTWMGGDEWTGAGLPTNLSVQLLDLIVSYDSGDRLKLAANADYASASRDGAGGGHWSGLALYARCQATASSAVALRWERFADSAGLRTGTAQDLDSLTATYEYAVGASLLNRLEYRHDRAGAAFFPSRGGRSRTQDTVTFGQVVRF